MYTLYRTQRVVKGQSHVSLGGCWRGAGEEGRELCCPPVAEGLSFGRGSRHVSHGQGDRIHGELTSPPHKEAVPNHQSCPGMGQSSRKAVSGYQSAGTVPIWQESYRQKIHTSDEWLSLHHLSDLPPTKRFYHSSY